jgi:hypothetical protein
MTSNLRSPDPAPEQIQEATAEIQRTWDRREERYRRVVKPAPLHAPTITPDDLPADSPEL